MTWRIFPGRRIQLEDDAAVLADAVQLALRTPAQAVWREVGGRADVAEMTPGLQVEHRDEVPGIGVVAVLAVAVDRHECRPAVRRDGHLVNARGEAAEGQHRVVRRGIEEQDPIGDLVHRDHAVHARS